MILRASSRLAMTMAGHFLLLNVEIRHFSSLSYPQSGNQGRLSFIVFFPPVSSTFTSPQQDKYWASQSCFTLRNSHALLKCNSRSSIVHSILQQAPCGNIVIDLYLLFDHLHSIRSVTSAHTSKMSPEGTCFTLNWSATVTTLLQPSSSSCVPRAWALR